MKVLYSEHITIAVIELRQRYDSPKSSLIN